MEGHNDCIPEESSQSLAMESSAGGAADKKRNKLGYHRTSVACVHCRRRKIRCLLASDDSQGRCENCIRLKKECHFYPVDQQPPMEKRSRASSKAEPPPPDAPVLTTPTLLGHGPLLDQKDSYFQYQSLPVNATPEMPVFSTGTYGATTIPPYSPDPTATLGAVQPLAQPASWENTSLYGQQVASVPPAIQSSPSGSVWGQNTTITTPISSLSSMGTSINPTGIVPSNAFGMVADSSTWSLQSGATVPLSGPEVTTPGYPSQLQPPLSPDYKGQIEDPARLYSIPLNVPVSGLQTATIPVSFGAQQQSLTYNNSWSGMTVSDPSASSQAIASGVPDPMTTWFAGDPQYSHLKGDTPIVTSPLQPFDPGAFHPMRER